MSTATPRPPRTPSRPPASIDLTHAGQPDRTPAGGGPPDGLDDPHRRGTLVLGVVITAVGLTWMAGELGLLDVGWRTLAAGGLVAAGLGTAVLGVTGHRAGPLSGVGIALAVLLAITATVPGAVVVGPIGDVVERPTAVADVAEPFEVGMGTLRLDLTDLPLEPGTTAVTAAVGAGELHVRVPEGVRVIADVSVGAGETRILGEDRSGVGIAQEVTAGPDGAARTLQLELSVTTGQVEVTR